MSLHANLAVVCSCLLIGLAVAVAHAGEQPKPAKLTVYVGTYTAGASKGIYRCTLDLASGSLEGLELAAETRNPSFLAIHPNKKFLYAVGEVADFEGKPSGGVSAFAIESGGKLKLLNQQSSKGAGPCHVSVHPSGMAVLVANYGGGSVAALPLDDAGKLGPASGFVQHQGKSADPGRQEGPHAHSVNFDAAGRFAIVADLGLDKVLVYRFNYQQGTLAVNNPPATTLKSGSGPRHFAFHPGGKFAYVINELASTVTALAYDARRGTLAELQTISTLPGGFSGSNTTAEVQVHPSGKFVFGSNRGHDSIAVFAVDVSTGKLTASSHQSTGGKTPRNFGIDPTGAYLLAANQDSDSIVVFRIDPATGALTPTGHTLSVPKPVCVKFLAL